MSKCAWVVGLAFGVVLCVGLGQAQEDASDEYGQASQQEQPAQSYPIPFPVEIVEDQAAAEARERREAESRQHEIDDLVAQQGMNEATRAMNNATQEMRDYAYVQTWLVGIGTALLLVTLRLTLMANRSAQAAVDVTREIGRDQTRAYANIHNAEVRWNGRAMRTPDIRLWVQNTGQTPAKWYEFRCACVVDRNESTGVDFGELNNRKAIRWNGLDSGANLSISHHDEQDVAAIKEAFDKRDTHTLKVFGDITYETFFGEKFVSQFYFFTHYLTAYSGYTAEGSGPSPPIRTPVEIAVNEMGGERAITVWKERPVMLSRGPADLWTYEKVE